MRIFFDILSHRPEIFASFLAHAVCCNILYSKYLQPRHLLGMSGQRYHRVIPLPECFGCRLSVRRLEAVKSVQRVGYTAWSRLCPV
jgi:hypothetical protein